MYNYYYGGFIISWEICARSPLLKSELNAKK
jgi:hypothetical protein